MIPILSPKLAVNLAVCLRGTLGNSLKMLIVAKNVGRYTFNFLSIKVFFGIDNHLYCFNSWESH